MAAEATSAGTFAGTFIDTNVLVYASRTKAMFHLRAAAALRGTVEAGGTAWFSRQIRREYLAVVTRPQPTEAALSNTAANADAARLLATLTVAEDGAQVTAELMRLLAL